MSDDIAKVAPGGCRYQAMGPPVFPTCPIPIHPIPTAKTHMSPLRNTTARPSRGRRIARVVTAIGIAAFAGGLAACADAPMSPSADASAAASLSQHRGPGAGVGYNVPLASPEIIEGVKRTTSLDAPVVATFDVGRAGGHMALPGTGLTVVVPPSALDEPTRITVTALPGDLLAYEFQPHGITFRKPLQMMQDLRGTNWQLRGPAPTLDVGYFPTPEGVDAAAGTAVVHEFLPAALDARGAVVQFDVHHFSGYIVAWGRKR